MCDGVGVPSFGQHGDGDDAVHLLAEFAGLADGVHDFAQQVLFGRDLVGIALGKARAIFCLELVDFGRGDFAELIAHGLAGFQLLAIHQDGVRAAGAIGRLQRC